ncbi:MAG TPA: hypothetical protein VKT81_03655 [Bryobacteraceae bacterium]|nr:hypothetical protein [Bryobacteraceae bacterium]
MKQLAVLFLIAAGAAICQEPDRVNVPFSDPSRPKTLKASVLNGSIFVKGYNGKEAIVEARGEGSKHRREHERTDGMHRIDIGGSGLSVEENDNVVTVGTRSMNENVEINIQVPFDTSLKLHDVNGGEIQVDHVNGDVEVDVTNGRATATHISGSAIVHALNDRVLVTLDKVTPDKPMSFSSLNGDIDVTLPADLKARVKLKSDNGEVYSDFDIKVDAASRKPIVENSGSGHGRYRVQFDKATYGLINGGGPEIQLTTFNGNIYIRKAK